MLWIINKSLSLPQTTFYAKQWSKIKWCKQTYQADKRKCEEDTGKANKIADIRTVTLIPLKLNLKNTDLFVNNPDLLDNISNCFRITWILKVQKYAFVTW